MLRSVQAITGFVLQAEDGDVGRCKDFLLDDTFWTVRYMVADTGKWLPGRRVLISPISLGQPDWTQGRLPVRLTKKQIEEAPGLDEDAPVSRRYEMKYHTYYGYPYYWGGGGVWGEGPYPSLLYTGEKKETESADDQEPEDVHLRSANEVTGYHIHASNGEIGHVEDFILDDETWIVQYMAVDTRNWLPGRKVLVAPAWITSIDWPKNEVTVDLTREAVKGSPEYNPAAPVNREYEAKLYDYYGRPVYW
jgi:hypothetical protein